MADQKGIKESLDQIGVADVMGKPRNDPRQTKEGFHITILQMIMQLWIQLGQKRKYRPMQTLLQGLKRRTARILQMKETDLTQNTRR